MGLLCVCTWPAVVRGVPSSCGQTLVRRRCRAQGGDHLHHVGQDHVTRADGAATLQNRTVGLLLYVEVRFNGHRPPTADRIYSDLLIVRAEGAGKEQRKEGLKEERRKKEGRKERGQATNE